MESGENKSLIADLAIINGDIWTGDKKILKAQAIAAQGDKIIFVGSNDEIKTYIKESTKVIDAKNSFIVPGFIDSHVHLLMSGERLNSVNLKNCKSKEEFVELIGEFAKKKEKGEWITGGDWDHIHWGGELPTRFWIDEVTKDNPVWIGRHEGHTYLANTLALEIAGLLNKNVPNIEGGTVVVNEEGVMTGIFKDNAIGLVFKAVPSPTYKELSQFLESASQYVIERGVTGIHHMTEPAERNRGGEPKDLEFYEEYDKLSKLKIRICAAVPIKFYKELHQKVQDNKGSRYASERLKFGCLKGYIDGSIGSHSASFFEDYLDTPNYSGQQVASHEELYEQILEADKLDLQIFIHAIGDKGINNILNIFERVIKVNGEKDRRWRIEHSQHINPSDIERFSKLGVIASVQPYHAIEDARFIEQILGSERLKGTYAFNSLLKSNAVLALGSDWFVAPPDPIVTIDAAVNRRVEDIVFIPEERITIEEALRSHTIDAAYSVFEENSKGSLTEGKLADITILSQNLLEIDPLEIRKTKVLATIIGGEVVYNNFNA